MMPVSAEGTMSAADSRQDIVRMNRRLGSGSYRNYCIVGNCSRRLIGRWSELS